MYLSENAKDLINTLKEEGSLQCCKAEISNAMSIIVTFHKYHADKEEERASLIETLNVLADYNKLVTELAKKK